MEINCTSSTKKHEKCVMYSNSNNIEVMINDKADEVLEQLFDHFFLDIDKKW